MPAPVTVERALRAIAGRRVVLVGDVVLDAYVYGQTMRVSREAPVIVVRKERTEHRLGGAANTAANLAALGVETRLLGVLGPGPDGRRIDELLSERGVDPSGLMPVERPDPIKTRILAGAFGTSRQQVLRLDDEPELPLPPEVDAALASTLAREAGTADAVVVSDYSLGTVGPEVIRAARTLASEGRVVCVDSRTRLRAFTGVTAVTPNLPEIEAVVGYAVDTPEAISRAGAELVRALGCRACLLTLGRGGMTLFDGPAPRHVDIVGAEEVTDVTGAGDTVMATFAAAAAADLGFDNGMRLANCAAAVVVNKLGASVATPPEIEAVARAHAVELLPWGG